MAFCNKDAPCGHDCCRQDEHGGDCDCAKRGCPGNSDTKKAPPQLFWVSLKTMVVADQAIDALDFVRRNSAEMSVDEEWEWDRVGDVPPEWQDAIPWGDRGLNKSVKEYKSEWMMYVADKLKREADLAKAAAEKKKQEEEAAKFIPNTANMPVTFYDLIESINKLAEKVKTIQNRLDRHNI